MKIKWLLSRIKWVARKEGSPLPNKSSTKSASFHSHSFDIYLHWFFLHILVHLPKHNVGYTELNVNLKFKYTLWLWNHRKQSLLMTFFFMLLLMSPILPPFLARTFYQFTEIWTRYLIVCTCVLLVMFVKYFMFETHDR